MNPLTKQRAFGAELTSKVVALMSAVGFYEHYGFEVFDRSETDGMGDPFPILHMRLCPTSHGSA